MRRLRDLWSEWCDEGDAVTVRREAERRAALARAAAMRLHPAGADR